MKQRYIVWHHFIFIFNADYFSSKYHETVDSITIYKNLSFVWFAWHTYSFPVLPVQWKLLWSHYILYLHFTAKQLTRKPLKCMCVCVKEKLEGEEYRTFHAKTLPPITVYSTYKRIFSAIFLLLPSVENTFPLRSFPLYIYNTETLPNVGGWCKRW